MSKIKKMVFCVVILSIFGSSGIALAKTNKVTSSRPLIKSSVTVSKSKATSVNINKADFASLQKIKGMGKIKAKAIVDYRAKNGQFKSVNDLLKVKCRGINEKWLNKISNFLTV